MGRAASASALRQGGAVWPHCGAVTTTTPPRKSGQACPRRRCRVLNDVMADAGAIAEDNECIRVGQLCSLSFCSAAPVSAVQTGRAGVQRLLPADAYNCSSSNRKH